MNRPDILQWLFQLIVNHTERAEENERLVRRLEISDEGLDLITKHGRHFRIIVRNPDDDSGTGQRNQSTKDCSNCLHLPQADWETLVEACESMLHFLKSLAEREGTVFGRRKEKGVQVSDPFPRWRL